jgi:hypothetical protein
LINRQLQGNLGHEESRTVHFEHTTIPFIAPSIC